jgi:hypothetical protein
VSIGGGAGDYNFNVQGLGSDTKHVTHQLPLTLHVINFAMTPPSPSSVTVGDYVVSRKFPDHCCRIVQSERYGFL